ncbi:hypothetical protein A2867_04980 [Candidatus Daviesbacteria bacterium RIFCSPHIGHO2_01_FULL_40_11]|uniref:TraC-like domain-containing protein n=1 Tax=Candidatus Daviesbacteria bacterium RIFCSPHIGHO2_01_FULL_40_11 TaxID=1797762 RepID=A0A1F5JI80_9BACT|nr:MAG: hypothetical protein A2867_04980 [Candidatus Daviesbacteria bacterium RIFCSPHIGHO2_01_FULL_40_11]
MNTTQKHLSISDIANDILLLKNGGGALVLQVSAVNFGLLSDREQVAIIGSFAQMLNSLSFSIQIVIHSERLNLSSYLEVLDKAQKAQANPLLSQMITEYKQFIQSTVKENEVLDKKFYIVIPLFSLELGLVSSKINLEQKIKTVLLPRRDQIIRQLARIGLKATQLSKQKLIEVFYNIYNGERVEKPISQPVNPHDLAVRLRNPQPIQSNRINQPSKPVNQQPIVAQPPIQSGQAAKTHPFVVEELEE